MSSMSELIERAQKLTRPCPEMDARIWCAVFAPPGAYVEQSPFNGAWCIYHGTNYHDPKRARLWQASNSQVQPVTRSIDAALRLVPKDYDWIIGNVNGDYGGTPYACVGDTTQHFAATPVLALTAACLKARLAMAATQDTEARHE